MKRPPYVTEADLARIIRDGLSEDVLTGDVTTRATVLPSTTAEGRFIAKDTGTIAGLAVVEAVFSALDPSVSITWTATDGQPVVPGMDIGRIAGPAIAVLEGERLALNLLQRMSGIATATAAMVRAVHGTGATILDTRKTVPGLRVLDKWAVRLGGGDNHRVGLHDMFLIKENHIAAAGSLEAALDRVGAAAAQNALRIEIEVASMDELERVLAHGGAHRVMLDNFARRTRSSVDTTLLREAVQRVGGRMETEASGNVDLDTVRAIAETGVDFISSGALTHSVRALDISLLLKTGTS